MTVRRFFVLMALLAGLCCFGATACAQQVTSNDLINRAAELDGQTVTFSGEAIGDIMRRGTYAWVNLHDGANAIGVWAPLEQTGAILYTGSYKARGDIVQVIGVFRRSCPEHGGDMDIHAASLAVLKQGYQVNEKVSMAKVRFVLILAAITVLVWILSLLKTR
jgi:hypothetical protein